MSTDVPTSAPATTSNAVSRGWMFVALGVVFFFVPVALWAVGVQSSTTEKRALAPFPSSLGSWDLMDEIAAYANDHVPFRGDAIRARGEISDRIFDELPPSATGNNGLPTGATDANDLPSGATSTTEVTVGTDDWLYLASELVRECTPADRNVVVDGIRRFQQILAASGREFVFTVAPDKSTAVPEHVVPGGPNEECAAVAKKATFDTLQQAAIPGYVNMRALIEDREAAEDRDYYFRQDTHWNGLADAAFAEAAAAIIDTELAEGTTVREREVQYTGDLTELLGAPSEDTGIDTTIVRDGVKLRKKKEPSRTEGAPGSIRTVARSKGALLFPGRTLIVGDSFSSAVLPKLQPYFASTKWVHSIAADKFQDALVKDIVASDTVIWVIVERYFTDATLGVVWTPAFLDRLQAALPPGG